MKQVHKVCMALHLATLCCVHLDSISVNCEVVALRTELVSVYLLLAEDQRRSVAAAHAKSAHLSSGDHERTTAVITHCWAHSAT